MASREGSERPTPLPELVVLSGGVERRAPVAGEITIGREPSNTIPVEDTYLSRRHVKIARQGERVTVADLRSFNGTFVNGQRIHEECFLLPGDVVKIGRTTLFVDWKDGTGSANLRIHTPDERPGKGIEPVVKTARPAVSDTYKALTAQLDKPRPASKPSKSSDRTRDDPGVRTAALGTRRRLHDAKTPVPSPSIEESAVARSGTSVSGSQSRTGSVGAERDGLRAIAQIARVLSRVEDETELLDFALGKVLEVIPAERGLVLRLDASGKALYPACVRNAVPERDESQARRLGISHTIAKKVLRERVSVLVSDARLDPRFKGSSSLSGLDVRSVLCAPIWLGEHVSGLVYLDHLMQAYMFTEGDRELLHAVANLMALGLDAGKGAGG